MSHNNIELENQVTEILRDIGMPASLKGFQYLRTAIVLAANDISMLNTITNKLYPVVSEKHKTTPSRTERAMRHALKATWERGGIEVLKRRLGNAVGLSTDAPSNREFIIIVAGCLALSQGELEHDSFEPLDVQTDGIELDGAV